MEKPLKDYLRYDINFKPSEIKKLETNLNKDSRVGVLLEMDSQ